MTSSSDSKRFASEASRNLTEEQQQRIERNKQLALERRQAKLLSNSQSLENGKFYAGFYELPYNIKGMLEILTSLLSLEIIPLGIEK